MKSEFIDLIKQANAYQNNQPLDVHSNLSINLDSCVWCGNANIQEDDAQGNQVCMDCGAVNGSIIDDTMQYKCKTDAHAFSGDAIRCNPVDDLLPKLSLSTKIVPQYGTKQSYYEHRIAKLNQWQSGDSLERAIKADFTYIDELMYLSGCRFPKNVLTTTKMLFKEYYIASYEDAKEFGGKRECLRGQTRKGMIGVCIYFACKINRLSCTKEYISELLGIEKSKIRKARPIFLATMKDRIINIDGWNTMISKISTTPDFIRTYQMILGIPYYITEYSIKLYKYLKPFRILGAKQPQSIAAMCIYVIITQLKTHITLDDIVEKCTISLATIKNLYKKVQSHLNEALVYVFTEHVCSSLGISNAITVDKITCIARTITNIDEVSESIKVIIGTSVMFVLILKEIHTNIDISDVCNVCNIKDHEVINLTKKILPYKNALIKRFI